MKLKVERINNHIVLVDESAEIKEEHFYYWKVTNSIQKAKKDDLGRLPKNSDGSFKIIFAEKELNLDVPLLPNWKEWEIEQLIYQRYFNKNTGECIRSTIGADDYEQGFKDGYNHNKKLYTEEDLIKAYWAGMQFVGEDKGNPKEFKKSLQKHPQFIVVENVTDNPAKIVEVIY